MIDTTLQDGIATLTLNRPPVNALNLSLLQALDAELTSAYENSEAVIITGRPGLFSAGLDIPEWLTYDRDTVKQAWHALFSVCRNLATAPVPVIAAINGHSPAGGAVLAMFCDERIMADGAFCIGLNEVQVGLAVPAEIHRPFERLLGKQTAQKLLLEGKLLSPSEALAVGFVDQVCPPEQLQEATTERLNTLLSRPRHAMLETRTRLRQDLVDMVGAPGQWDLDAMADAWLNEHTQAALHAVVAALKAGKK